MIVKKITKNSNFYNVLTEDDKKIKLHENIIIKYKIFKRKIEIKEELLEKIILENEFYLAFENAIKYVNAIHSKRQVYLHLLKKYPKDISIKVVNKLEEMNLINDLEYARFYMQKSYKNLLGYERVKTHLISENIDIKIIHNILEEYDFNLEEEACSKVFNKYLPNLKKNSSALAKNKMVKYLQEKGFSSNIIRKTLEKDGNLLDNINKDDELLNINFEKLFVRYKTKYKKEELKQKLIRSLAIKGFSIKAIIDLIESREEND